MNDTQTCARRGFLAYVTLLILVCPFVPFAAGTGAFLGMVVAFVGWGPAFLGSGLAVGAGVGVVLLGAWVIIFVVCAKKPKIAPVVYAEKVASFVQDMKNRGVSSNVAVPPFFRLACMLGFQLPPPLFRGFWANFVSVIGLVGSMCASALALVWWDHPNSEPTVMVIVSLIAVMIPLGLGAIIAIVTRQQARKYQLPTWDHHLFQPSQGMSDATQ